jgi:hypothetical protein
LKLKAKLKDMLNSSQTLESSLHKMKAAQRNHQHDCNKCTILKPQQQDPI